MTKNTTVPAIFQFATHTHSDYTATRETDGRYRITWPSNSKGALYHEVHVRDYLSDRQWTITNVVKA